MTEEVDMTFKDVSKLIEEYVAKTGSDYIDAAVDVCLNNNIEFESLKRTLSKSIKDKIELEASNRNLLKYRLKTIVDL